MITITCNAREGTLDKTTKQLRRAGYIPYVIYSKGQEAKTGVLLRTDVEAALRSIRPGFLPTTQFALKDASGQISKAIVREIQYEPTTYVVMHIDFLELDEKSVVEVKVPVEFVNTVDCVGVKLGGLLRHIMRHVKVRCLPANLPSHFEIDVKELGIRQSKRIKDIALPAGVKFLAGPEEIVASIAKR